MKVSFKLPLPPRALSSNNRAHRFVKYREGKWYREFATVRAKEVAPLLNGRKFVRPTITYNFYCMRSLDPGYRPTDDDNADSAMKTARDGFAQVLFEGGNDKNVRQTLINFFSTKEECQGQSGVLVEITEDDV